MGSAALQAAPMTARKSNTFALTKYRMLSLIKNMLFVRLTKNNAALKEGLCSLNMSLRIFTLV